MIFATHASSAVATEKAAEELSAMTYRGPSVLGQRYGVLSIPLATVFVSVSTRYGMTYQMKEAFITVVTMPIATAFFSGVWPHVEPHHPRISELTPYVPMVKIIMAT
jgi:uncharacterized membrane protein